MNFEQKPAPKKINFIEMGPGNGDLCLSILQTLKNYIENPAIMLLN